jgi:hypothetical protein
MQQHDTFAAGNYGPHASAVQGFSHRWERQVVAARQLVALAHDFQLLCEYLPRGIEVSRITVNKLVN